MAKEKFTLDQLKSEAKVTTLQASEMQAVKGGIVTIRGRRFNYRTRWTTIDTRTDIGDSVSVQNNSSIGG